MTSDTTPTLAEIEAAAKAYAEARTRMGDLGAELDAAVTALKRQHLPAIKRALARTAERQAELKALIERGPALFVKPRTLVLHGIKLGYVKGKGQMSIDDEARTCTLIERHFPDQADALIRTERRPVKAALAQMSVADLKRVAVIVTDTGDQVVIKAVDSDVDKLIDALLRNAVDTAVEAAEAATEAA
jgi:hypothetical protein